MPAPTAAAPPPASIEVRGLTKSYGDHRVLRGIDLTVPRGTVFALLGPNGAGKTTLVRALATLQPFDGGTARVEGRDVRTQPAAVRGLIGLTGQYASVDELLTGEENLVMVGRLLHLGRARARRRAAELLDRFDLTAAARRQTRTYSGGMRRRLDLAASLMASPPVVFLDEPTTGLDPRSRRTMWDVVRAMVADGTTVLLTTQYLEEADRLADRIAVLHGGRVATEGTAAELKAQVGRERVTLTLARPADLPAAARLLRAADPQADPADGTLSLPLHRTDDLRALLNALADARLPVTAVRITAPTLDDVFFAVTAPAELETAR
ncbi:ATP-binding cassette domain-containing protein [Allonocardiopsis opalescens]|uniref:ABC-2 type transport system ATP-binding protein n=1 Tax=Allonocardiopsis opalescens TaxID=1144618 RepID=A0A2T0Q421_9ACTN|nr:ATP-binding cassette domain-containing protein [Allonocardiopsis opalescens]PRX98549.1 ABC-2 type transport system ATP-binding protein [Allonocardiopsis opalescens]